MGAHVNLFRLGKPRVAVESGGVRCSFDLQDHDGHVNGQGSLHYDDVGLMAEWLAEWCEGFDALLASAECSCGAGHLPRHRPDPCDGGSLPDRQGEVEG